MPKVDIEYDLEKGTHIIKDDGTAVGIAGVRAPFGSANPRELHRRYDPLRKITELIAEFRGGYEMTLGICFVEED